jgi:hypothetical protein
MFIYEKALCILLDDEKENKVKEGKLWGVSRNQGDKDQVLCLDFGFPFRRRGERTGREGF